MRSFISVTAACLIFFVFLFSAFSKSSAVSVAPNKAVLTGTVREYSVGSSSLYGMSPEQTVYKLTIMVEASEDIADYLNSLKGKEGQIQIFFTKTDPTIEVYGKRIRAHVFYSGDERGGKFWIHKNIEIIK